MHLVDTNVVSELRKVRAGKADPAVSTWAADAEPGSLFLSAISVHELELGVRLMEHRDTVQGDLLRRWLDDAVLPAFAGRILPVDEAVARQAAVLHVPNPQPLRDGLIAATALVHNLVVVTRNLADFKASGVRLLNPWEFER